MKYVGKLASMLLIRVTLSPLEKYIIFQLANQHYLLNNTVPNMLGLVGSPQSPRYFTSKEETSHLYRKLHMNALAKTLAIFHE
jgi:hypothetical protein